MSDSYKFMDSIRQSASGYVSNITEKLDEVAEEVEDLENKAKINFEELVEKYRERT